MVTLRSGSDAKRERRGWQRLVGQLNCYRNRVCASSTVTVLCGVEKWPLPSGDSSSYSCKQNGLCSCGHGCGESDDGYYLSPISNASPTRIRFRVLVVILSTIARTGYRLAEYCPHIQNPIGTTNPSAQDELVVLRPLNCALHPTSSQSSTRQEHPSEPDAELLSPQSPPSPPTCESNKISST